MVVLAGMLMACGLGYSQNNNKIGKRIDGELIDAVSALDEGQYKEAQVTLERILTADPRNDAAQYYLGMCRLYANDLDGAKTAFKKAAELDPSNFWYKERLARTYSLTGEDDLTIATYEALLKDYPKKDDIYFTLVNLYLKQSQYDKALGALDQIEAVFGKSENVTATKYDILLRQNKPEEAFKVLTDFNKEFSSPYVLTKLGDHSMAEYKDTAALDGLLSGDYKGLVGKVKKNGTQTQTPPDTTDGVKSRAEIYKKDDKGRYLLSTAERQAALAQSLASENE